MKIDRCSSTCMGAFVATTRFIVVVVIMVLSSTSDIYSEVPAPKATVPNGAASNSPGLSAPDTVPEGGDAPLITQMIIQGAPFSQPLKDLPQSATVLTAKVLNDRASTNIQDSIDTVPGLSYSAGTARPRFFLIRGVGELEQYTGAPNPSIASIVDDIDFSGLGIVTPLFDIDQVEVLRGPQGIRFGSSALGGAINVRSKSPEPFTSGTVQLGTGNDELETGGAAVGGSIPGTDDKLMMRVSAFSSRSNGFRNDPFLSRDDTNKRDESMIRVKLRYAPQTWLTFDLTGFKVESNNGFDAFAIDNSFTTQSDRPGRDALNTGAGSFKTTAKLPNAITVVDIASLARASQQYSYDGDWGNNPFWGVNAPYDYFSDSNRERRTYSNEIRAYNDDPMYEHGESIRWLGGAYVSRLTENTATSQFSNNEIYDDLDSRYRATTKAGFGQLELPLGGRTSFTAGSRVERRDAGYDDSKAAQFSPGYTMLGGNLTLQHDLTMNSRVYLIAARGFKGGGFNAGPTVPNDRKQYNPEYLWNFESGVKGAWFNKTLETNVALFHDRRRNQQLKLAIQDNPSDPLSFTYITESSARGRNTGVELESTYHILPVWDLFASGSIMDSEFTSVPTENQSLEGRGYSHAPAWQYYAGTRSELGAGIFARLEVTGKDRFYFDDSHNQRSNPYTLTNVSLGWHHNGWRVTTWVRNAFDQRYATRGFYFGNEPPDYPNKLYIQRGDPRAFGITLAYDF